MPLHCSILGGPRGRIFEADKLTRFGFKGLVFKGFVFKARVLRLSIEGF